MKRLLLAPLAVALFLAIAPVASATTGPGALSCPLTGFNPTKYGIKVGTTVTCTIVGATGISGSTTPVIIQSSDFGNTTLTGTVSGSTITFTYTAPVSGCNTVVVAYGSTGNLADNAFLGNGKAAAGFALLDANGNVVTTCSTPPDTTPPTCTLTAILAGPPKQLQVTVQDTGSGIKSVVPVATNATTSIASFTSGATSPILVTATKTNPAFGSTLKLTVTDVAGNVTVCDPVLPGQRVLTLAGTKAHTLAGLSNGFTTVLVRNGAHAGSVLVRVNGHTIRIGRLAAHQARRVDIAPWMVSGRHNRIVVQKLGRTGRSTVIIA